MERRISVGIFRPKYVNQLKRWIFRSEEIETNHSIWIPTEISGIFGIMEAPPVWIERERERLLNLSARSNFKWTDQSWGWNDLASGLCASLWGKPKRRILRRIFRSSRVFRPPKHRYLEWNLLGFMVLLVLLRFWTFPFEEKAICGVTSGQRWIEWSAFRFF